MIRSERFPDTGKRPNAGAAASPGGDEAYFIYRFLSPYLHANAITADRYLFADPDYSAAPTLRIDPHVQDIDRWMTLYVLVMSLLWSGDAVDERMEAGHGALNSSKLPGPEDQSRLAAIGGAFQRVVQAENARRRIERGSRRGRPDQPSADNSDERDLDQVGQKR